MKRILLLPVLAALSVAAHAGDDRYAVANIPAKLLTNAHAVKRTEEIRFEVTAPGDARQVRHWVVTVLDESGRDAAQFVEQYNKLWKVTDVTGALYDAQGKLQRRLKPKEVGDQSAVGDISLMDDSRVRFHHFDYPTYPYTVEYEVVIQYSTTIFLPHWVPQDDEHLSVQKSTLTLATPPGFNYRYKAFQYNGEPLTTASRFVERTWTAQDLPAFEAPYAGPLWHEMTPAVFFGGQNFTYGPYNGSAESWDSFGRFIATLNQGRDELPPALKQKVHTLTDGISDPREKVRRLYSFLQQNTRYISIQMGVGGMQTFEARFVADKGYGDCKALSNYMYSLLKEAGVPSCYAVIHAGEKARDRNLIEEVPYSQFNHAILCVPLPKDSIWLECTSQLTPPGYMGSFTGNRKALLVTPEGGRVVATPHYTFADNLQQRHAKGSIDANGDLSVQVSTLFRAEQQDDMAMLVQSLSREKVKRYLDENLGLPTYEVVDFHYEPQAGILPELRERLDLVLPGFLATGGKRLFVAPNFLNRSRTQFEEEEERKFPIYLRQSYTDIDSVDLTIPDGFEVEAMPKAVQLRTAYGNYSTEYSVKGNQLHYVRRRECWPANFPASEWEQVRTFYNSIYKADRASIVFVKKQ
ncbi:MAG: DUF3857 domain-containing protein [Chitinophagaceae bacterium]|nr:MAG: DUF3857 domain-containing protein [Chitinophagaceae bacterium]